MAKESSSNGLEKRPKLRFPGFDGAWKVVALGNILQERNEYSEKDGSYEHATLSKEGIYGKTARYDRDFLVSTENKKYKVTHYNDLCYNPANLKFGVICLNKYGDAIFSPIYITFEIDEEVDVDFLGANLTRWDFINRALRFQQGTVYERMAVSPEDFLSIQCYLPSKAEQICISSFVQSLDKRIDKQEKLVEALKKYKRGLVEAFLTKKIRFSNNGSPYEDWKWVTLSEIGEFFGGLSGKTKEDFGHGTDSFITYMNVYKNTFATSDGIMPVSIKPSEKQNHIQYGDVLFTQSSETVEEVGLSSVWLHKSRPYLNSFCMALRPYDLAKINSMYLGYVLRSQAVREQIMKEGQGISRINLSGSRILNVGFWMPSYAEQNKIVDVLMRLDEICRISSEKLSELSVMKSSIMQQLFI